MTTKVNPSQRTYGTKLIEMKRGIDRYPVTKRICDVELLNHTGEVRYIDEEAENVPTVSQIENGKKLREEITTLEQFVAIGSYRDVAKRYNVAPTSAHGLLQSLKAKKAREEKEVDNQNARIISGAQNGGQVGPEGQTACICANEGVTEDYGANVGEQEDALPDKVMDKMDGNLDLQIGQMWEVIKSDLEIIHKLHIERAEQVFREQLTAVMARASN